MRDEELDALLGETLSADVEAPNYLNTRLKGELAVARETGWGISLWWLPLALAVAAGLPVFMLGVLAPWPARMVLQVSAVAAVAAAAVFTAVGLACFNLREKGRVLL